MAHFNFEELLTASKATQTSGIQGAGSPLLFIGAPGTTKTGQVRSFCDSVGDHCEVIIMGRIPNHLFIVDDDLCYGCGACIALCPVDALILEGLLAIVDEPACTHCEHCIPACPVFALEIVPEASA